MKKELYVSESHQTEEKHEDSNKPEDKAETGIHKKINEQSAVSHHIHNPHSQDRNKDFQFPPEKSDVVIRNLQEHAY